MGGNDQCNSFSTVERAYHQLVWPLVKFGIYLNHKGFALNYLVLMAFKRDKLNIPLYLLQTGVNLDIPRGGGNLNRIITSIVLRLGSLV